MTIPEIRKRLHELAVSAGIRELADLAEATRRRRCVRVAPVKGRRLTELERAEIRRLVWAHPHLHLHDIAGQYGVNPGRISETIRGKRQ